MTSHVKQQSTKSRLAHRDEMRTADCRAIAMANLMALWENPQGQLMFANMVIVMATAHVVPQAEIRKSPNR